MIRLSIMLILFCESVYAVRLKDIASLRGARDNQLVGYGVVVGLAGTGDNHLELTEGSLANVLKGLGVDLKNQKLDAKNTAAVVAYATLPPFGRVGSRVDVSISSVGSASSLDGGTLVLTSLKAADGNVYAIAQGRVVTQQKPRQPGLSVPQNLVTANVPGGAILEREVNIDFSTQRELRYQLRHPDFTTAVRVAKRINDELSGKYATAADAATIDVMLPFQYEGNAVEMIAQVENVEVETDLAAKVVVNTRTGTVVMGDQVRVAPVAIAQNNLKIEIRQEARQVSAATTEAGEPLPIENATATVKQKKVLHLGGGSSVADIVTTLNEMGAGSDDLVALIQSLKASGALMAELEMQ